MATIERTSKEHTARQGRRRGTMLLAAAGATTALVLAAGGVAAASASGQAPSHGTSTTAPAAPTAKAAAPAHPALQRLLRHTMEAQFVVRTKSGQETFQYDRGVIRSVTSSKITITPAATPSSTVSATITSSTRFKGLPETQLQPGDHVALLSQGGDAVVVGAKAPASSGSPSSTSG